VYHDSTVSIALYTDLISDISWRKEPHRNIRKLLALYLATFTIPIASRTDEWSGSAELKMVHSRQTLTITAMW